MEHISFEGVNLAELLPRIPDSVKDGLPFGLVKLDMTGKILEYNMAEGDLTGVSPAWAIGKNFFDEVAMCTKTAAFYGRFVEGVKKGFINAVFDYTFDHRETATMVKVHMVTVPDHLGRKNVMILVKRANKPLVFDAVPLSADPMIPAGYTPDDAQATLPAPLESFNFGAAAGTPANATGLATSQAAASSASIQDIVAAVVAMMNQNGASATVQSTAQSVVNTLQGKAAPAATPAPPPAASAPAAPIAPPAASAPSRSKIEDILKF